MPDHNGAGRAADTGGGSGEAAGRRGPLLACDPNAEGDERAPDAATRPTVRRPAPRHRPLEGLAPRGDGEVQAVEIVRFHAAPLEREYLKVERLSTRYLDVKGNAMENPPVSGEERDHVDRFLDDHADALTAIDTRVEAIVDRISGIERRLKHALQETLAAFDLSHGEWRVLTTLRWADPPHRRSAGELARTSELSTGAMTNRLDRLERAGLVRRLPDPEDRRGVQVELTEEGRRTWEQSVVAQAEKEAIVAAALSPDEMDELNRLLRRVMVELERREGKR
jgi:DNA-binding MarR family transcriptional regulator